MRLARYHYPISRRAAGDSGFRSPWSGLENEIDRLFQSTLAGFGGTPNSQFPVDLYEDKNNVYVRAELPGVNRDHVNVEIVNGYLTISASRKSSEGEAEESFSFNRSLSLSEEVQTEKVSAAYENGILTVTLPKREEAKPKKVTVSIK